MCLKKCQGTITVKESELLLIAQIFRQDVLEEVISEKDSQIAELEMKGVLDDSETRLCDALKSERGRLLDRLKIEVKISLKKY